MSEAKDVIVFRDERRQLFVSGFMKRIRPMPDVMQKRRQKYILRKLAERVGVPKKVLYRRKQGFALPLVHWIRNEMRELIMTVLL